MPLVPAEASAATITMNSQPTPVCPTAQGRGQPGPTGPEGARTSPRCTKTQQSEGPHMFSLQLGALQWSVALYRNCMEFQSIRSFQSLLHVQGGRGLLSPPSLGCFLFFFSIFTFMIVIMLVWLIVASMKKVPPTTRQRPFGVQTSILEFPFPHPPRLKV